VGGEDGPDGCWVGRAPACDCYLIRKLSWDGNRNISLTCGGGRL